jgi:hypothetical protein
VTHDTFGKLKYRDRDESWAGYAPLPRFAAAGIRPEPPPMTEEDMAKLSDDLKAAVENMKNLMRERFGEQAAAALEEVDRAAEQAQREAEEEPQDPDPREEEREQRRAERRQKHANRLAKGRFPIRIAGPGGEEPTPRQEAAFRHLLDNEQAVYDAVLAQVWASFQDAYDQEHWRQINSLKPAANVEELKDRFAVTRLDIAREARGGFAHLTFLIDSDWQDEHGLMVVYSPDTRTATWSTWDGLFDLLESDDPADQPEEYVPTPHDELLEAILTGDEKQARKLIDAGADINELGPDEYPPLWIAVDQMEVEEVRRLLAFGADPNLRNEDERTTPLRHAKKMYREMGFGAAKKKDAMMEGILSMMKEAAGKQFEDIRLRLEEIIRLLEDAGGREK